MLFRAVIEGPPRTKKTSSRVVHLGPKCHRCHRGTTARVLPSEAFEAWEKEAAPQLREAWAASCRGGRLIVCARCKGAEKDPSYSGACIGCGGTGSRPEPIAHTVHVEALIYRDALRGDWTGFAQAIGDGLQTAGVIVNDELIKSWDRTRLHKDARRPRIEIVIYPFDEPREEPSQLDLITPTKEPAP